MRWQRIVLSVFTAVQFAFIVRYFELWSRFGAVKNRVANSIKGLNSDSSDDENDTLNDDKIKTVTKQRTKAPKKANERKRNESGVRKQQNATNVEGDRHADNSTKISWLMSFPNSGTSYTLLAIRLASNHLVASNYDSGANKDNPWPVYAGKLQGPHWSGHREDSKEVPSKYILTKTHCGGFGRKDFKDFASVDVFTKKCLEGYYFLRQTGETEKVHTTYSADLVGSAVHVIRNPLDNIVARFHLFCKSRGLTDRKDSRKHFMEFCAIRDLFMEREKHVPDYLKKIPCRTEFYQYANWHNMAFKTTKQLGIDTHVLHYEKFSTNCTKTTLDILDFLELKWERKGKEFISGKEYSHLYTGEEKKDIGFALQNLSSDRTWSQIRHYFEFNRE